MPHPLDLHHRGRSRQTEEALPVHLELTARSPKTAQQDRRAFQHMQYCTCQLKMDGALGGLRWLTVSVGKEKDRTPVLGSLTAYASCLSDEGRDDVPAVG